MSTVHGELAELRAELAELRATLASTASTARLTALEGEVARLSSSIDALLIASRRPGPTEEETLDEAYNRQQRKSRGRR